MWTVLPYINRLLKTHSKLPDYYRNKASKISFLTQSLKTTKLRKNYLLSAILLFNMNIPTLMMKNYCNLTTILKYFDMEISKQLSIGFTWNPIAPAPV